MNRILWCVIYFAVLIWSCIQPKDYLTWFLEVSPALIGFGVVIATRNSFPLTPLSYILILIHCVILMIGGHYTYAEVPLFDWIRETFNQERNNYDKVGHFAQEIVIRFEIIREGGWRIFFILCFCLAMRAFYELIEWWVALLSGESAEAFLGTQGYIWDTQSDMWLALLGAGISLIVLSGIHDRQLAGLRS